MNTIEIARSFSYKKNIGNYESADFFCSAKKECLDEEKETVSAALYEFCKTQVRKDLVAFEASLKRQPILSTMDNLTEAERMNRSILALERIYEAMGREDYDNQTRRYEIDLASEPAEVDQD